MKSTGRRIVDTAKGWNNFKKKAPLMMKKTCDMWTWFENNEYTMNGGFDEKDKCARYTLTGIPNHEYIQCDEEDDPVQTWLGTIDHHLNQEGSHESLDEANLWNNSKEYDKKKIKMDDLRFIIINPILQNKIEKKYLI